MNLLVTNTHAPQAYDVIRALRPHANKIVATMEGSSRFKARLCHGAQSRFVDRRYFVPSPVKDWQAGKVQIENTENEEAFIQAVLRICEAEKIDLIFPSWDPHVYVLSKNKQRLKKAGAVVTVPDFDTVLTALDKYRSIQAAREVGFPCPRTYLYDRQLDLRAVAEEEGFPLVIKPRFTSGSRGMAIVKDYNELSERLPKIVENHNNPMIQEYIPGGYRESVQFVIDRNGAASFIFHKKRHRELRVIARFGAVSESALPEPHVPLLTKLISKIGWWGAAGIETIVDPRDGVHKLMEINPRFPRQLWNRTELGINEPLMCVKAAYGEPVEPVAEYPIGVLFVCPVEDLQLLALQILDRLAYQFRTRFQKNVPLDKFSPPISIREQTKSFIQTYFDDRKSIFDPYFRYFFQDPLVSIIWWLQFSTWAAGSLKNLGR